MGPTAAKCRNTNPQRQYVFRKIVLIKFLSQLGSLHFHYPLKITFRIWLDRRRLSFSLPVGAFNANKKVTATVNARCRFIMSLNYDYFRARNRFESARRHCRRCFFGSVGTKRNELCHYSSAFLNFCCHGINVSHLNINNFMIF